MYVARIAMHLDPFRTRLQERLVPRQGSLLEDVIVHLAGRSRKQGQLQMSLVLKEPGQTHAFPSEPWAGDHDSPQGLEWQVPQDSRIDRSEELFHSLSESESFASSIRKLNELSSLSLDLY